MIQFRDFIPQQRAEAVEGSLGIVKAPDYESFDLAVAAAAQWIEFEKIDVIQLETVVLPNIWRREEEGTIDASLRASGEVATWWHQFLRVWYRPLPAARAS